MFLLVALFFKYLTTLLLTRLFLTTLMYVLLGNEVPSTTVLNEAGNDGNNILRCN